MEPKNRREFLAAAAGLPLAIPLLGQGRGAQATPPAAPRGMFVSIHQASTARFDFKTSCEGISKAGVRAVEVDIAKIQEFARTESLPKAKQLLDDLGLRVCSASNHLGFVDQTAAGIQGSLDQLKTKLEVVQAVGGDRIVCPSTLANRAATEDDFKRGAENMVKGGDLAKTYGVSLMLEFAKTSMLANSIQTALRIIREANHPNAKVMVDTFHFYGGVGKVEDLELLRDGELAHLHFEDIPNLPTEQLNSQASRLFPGDGVAPLKRTIEILKRKGYSGPASMELFQNTTPVIQMMDPFQVASRAKAQIEPLIA